MLEKLGNVLLLLPRECFDRNANYQDVSTCKHVRLHAWEKKKVYPWYTRFLNSYKCMQWLIEIKTREQDLFQVFHRVKNTFSYDVYDENGKWEKGQTKNHDKPGQENGHVMIFESDFDTNTILLTKLRNQCLSLENSFAFLDMSSILEELWNTLTLACVASVSVAV